MNPIITINRTNPCLRVPSLRREALFAGIAIITMLLANSCSTAKGFGKDVEKTGDKIQEAASR